MVSETRSPCFLRFRFEIFGVGLDEHQRARVVDGNVECGTPASAQDALKHFEHDSKRPITS